MNRKDEILILLTELKSDVEDIKANMVQVKDNSNRIDKLESFTDRVKGMTIIVVSVFTVIFTLAYDFVKKTLIG